jgi:hypothetical protein
MNANVVVSEGQGNWGNTPEIADISEENIVTLFTPPSYSSPNAWSVGVRCEDLEITDIPQGSCPLRIKILKRYGPEVKLGEIKSWEDRFQAAAKPVFNKGGAAFQATYGKAGSSERRSIYVYASNDGANSFLLEASTGESICGSNEAVSKNFLVLEVEYKAAGFERSGSGTSGSSHRLFIQ